MPVNSTLLGMHTPTLVRQQLNVASLVGEVPKPDCVLKEGDMEIGLNGLLEFVSFQARG